MSDEAKTLRERLRAHLPGEEGVVLRAYKDSVGVLTIGIGCNLERPGVDARLKAMGLPPTAVRGGWPITTQQAMMLLEADLDDALADARRLFGQQWEALHPDAQLVIADMVFNLGYHGVLGFTKMLAALIYGPPDYLTAAKEMKDSKWHHQVGKRAVDLEALMAGCAEQPMPTEPPALFRLADDVLDDDGSEVDKFPKA